LIEPMVAPAADSGFVKERQSFHRPLWLFQVRKMAGSNFLLARSPAGRFSEQKRFARQPHFQPQKIPGSPSFSRAAAAAGA